MTMNLVRSLGVGSCLKWDSVNMNGAARGILVFWDFRVVYGPCFGKEREGLWEELGAIKGLWNDPWCVGGDFNVGDEKGVMGAFKSLFSEEGARGLILKGYLLRCWNKRGDEFKGGFLGGGGAGALVGIE
ncbi:hypothetical protein CK203_115573 [Vitis vinifera]|uniref:Endonuclease/exonuclease/phosphatase domain-containing protein n=1 Tax=Vitis vinifera TaxID=29760 RepID=A0A438FHR3_VITVI|nr:hypothetical protein CK203_115573 [Vitis vinifera]